MSVTLLSEVGFYVGDPSYVLTDQEFSTINNLEGKGVVTDSQTGEQFNVFSHHVGGASRSAVFEGYRQRIAVDSGSIGVIPMELIDQNNWDQSLGEFFNTRSIQVEVEQQGVNVVFTIQMGGEEYQIIT